jgi:mono/diheme cytochrome c family protein
VNGQGGTVGPDLARVSRARSFVDLAAAMWNHIPDMRREMTRRGVQRPQLMAWEAADLIAFLYWLDYFDEPGDPAQGARLFRDRQCVGCHQVRGLGGVLAPDLGVLAVSRTPIMIAAGMWNHAPAMTSAMRARGIRRPRFTGDELRDLLAYLAGPDGGLPTGGLYVVPGQAGRGARLFEQKRCLGCHPVAGTGGRVGPDLGAERRYGSVLDFAAAMWNKGPAMIEAMAARGVEIPELRSDEMADLVAYLYAGRYFGEAGVASRGGELLRERGCGRCHGSDLGGVGGLGSPSAMVAALWNHLTAPIPADTRWPRLDGAAVADLAAYFESRGR